MNLYDPVLQSPEQPRDGPSPNSVTERSDQEIPVDVLRPEQIRSGMVELDGPSQVSLLSHHPGWLRVLDEGLKQTPYLVVATGKQGAGFLPLALVASRLFGRYLVSLPYLNSGGVRAADPRTARALIDRAVRLADELDVKHLELRHETQVPHPALTEQLTSKVHLRLPLPTSEEALWKSFKPKVRNQIRKGEKRDFDVFWGANDLVDEFYTVFSRNMRDLGTPVYGKRLFTAILKCFPGRAEFCVVRQAARPIAAALLLHGDGVTEVPSASSLRRYNSSNVNMFMYWQLLRCAVERRQATFDFGRSTENSNTFRFKKQWGALPEPAVWQYYVRTGDSRDLRREHGKYSRAIAVWQRMPLVLTRLLGPIIVRGIP